VAIGATCHHRRDNGEVHRQILLRMAIYAKEANQMGFEGVGHGGCNIPYYFQL
jgi:hypothetical protein